MDVSKLLNARSVDQEAIKSGDSELCKKVFSDNASLLKEFISVNGWPFREKFGSDASAAAWLIAQHADHDSMFQLQCLSFILVDLGDDPDSRQDVAFLLDRVLLNHGSKQLFGTQMNGSVGVPDVLDKKNLGMLREKFCLEPLDQYIGRMKRYSQEDK